MLGEKIYHLRKGIGISQEELASQLTVSRQAISKWELGESIPDTENIIQLTKIFNVSADYLLNDDVDIPIGTNAGEEAEQDIELTMLKKALGDTPSDDDKLALEAYKSHARFRNQHKLLFYILEGLGTLIFFGIIAYFIFFR